MDQTIRRLDFLKNHLVSSSSNEKNSSEVSNALGLKSCGLSKAHLYNEYYSENSSEIELARRLLSESDLFDHFDLNFMTRSEKYLRLLKQVVYTARNFPMTQDLDSKNPIRKITIAAVLSEFDISTSGRYGVHIGLYIDTVQNLGTQKHKMLIDKGYSLKHYGCFALTELGHGSNVAGIETVAIYDSSCREFIINSPTRTSAKWWIGAAAKTANMAVVWAQLILNGENKGVQAFVVEIRDYKTHETKPGVIIGDCGKKIELDGIDNGFLIFKDFRVSYDCLLDYYSQITEEGKFKTTIKNKEKRLGLMLGGLIRGRILVVAASEATLRNALTIALRFASRRTQFGEPNEPEKSILSYQVHKCRLVPYLSKLFAIRVGENYIFSLFRSVYPTVRESPDSEELAELHAFLSFLKGYASSTSFAGIQECRESCGGLGFSAHASLGRLRNTTDIKLTWEGDNNVLVQQTGKYILKQIQRQFKGVKTESKTLQFLKIDLETGEWPLKSENDFNLQNFVNLFETRVCLLAKQSISKIQKNSSVYSTVSEAWNNSQYGNITLLSKFYGECVILKEFQKFVERISKKSKATGEIVYKLCELFALDCLEKDQRSYLELGCNSNQAMMIREKYVRLCEEISEASLEIINSVASPDKLIGSVIGKIGGEMYDDIFKVTESEQDVYSKPDWFTAIEASRKD